MEKQKEHVCRVNRVVSVMHELPEEVMMKIIVMLSGDLIKMRTWKDDEIEEVVDDMVNFAEAVPLCETKWTNAHPRSIAHYCWEILFKRRCYPNL